jgi:hypothetical protein
MTDARGYFHAICYRIACDDATLVNMETDQYYKAIRSTEPNHAWTELDLITLGTALVGNTQLKSLHLSFPNNVNCTSDRAVKTIRQGMAQSQVQSLEMIRPSFQLQQCLCEGVKSLTTFQMLTFSDTQINIREIAKLLRPNVMPSSSPSSQPLQQQQCQLTRLTLTSCDLCDFDVLTLSLALADNPWLLSLKLENNGIGDVGILYFCQHWKDESPLYEIKLGHNKISASGALHLLRATDQHPAIQTIGLARNYQIGVDGLCEIAQLLPHIRLHCLEVNHCIPSTTTTTRRSSSKSSSSSTHDDTLEMAHAWANNLRQTTTLRTLHFGGNNLGPRGVQLIMQAIASNPTLQRLSFAEDETIGYAGLCHIGRQLPHTRLTALRLDGIIPWRLTNKGACQAGDALLKGVLNNETLTIFHCPDLHHRWLIPITFHTKLNAACRPLFRQASQAVWPQILAYFDRHDRRGHAYFCLKEQPWLIMRSSGGENM